MATSTQNLTFLDSKTGLTWQLGFSKLLSWDEAQTYAESLDCDCGGWRLPTRHELMSLVDDTRINPAIDTTIFPDTPAEWFWTSTVALSGKSCVWYVNFSTGHSDNYFKHHEASKMHVRCVR